MVQTPQVEDGAERPAFSPARRELLERLLRGDAPAAPPTLIPRRPTGQPIPLSFGQRQLWLLYRLAPQSPVYNESVTVRIAGPVDVPALRRALQAVLERHEGWRCTFHEESGEPVARVVDDWGVDLREVDLSMLAPAVRDSEAARLATVEARLPFDLSAVPPLRALLVHLDDSDHRLYLTLHHIIFDGITIYAVFPPELIALYRQEAGGLPAQLPDLPVQYSDFAAWQHSRREELSAGLDYWRERLAGDLPPPTLPFGEEAQAQPSGHGAVRFLRFTPEESLAVQAVSRAEGVTPFMTLMAAFAALLSRYSGAEDLIIGTVTGVRGRPELERLLGYFLNTLAIRLDLTGDPSFSALLRRTRDSSLAAFDNGETPFEMVVGAVQPDRASGGNGLFNVMLTLDPPEPAYPDGWSITRTEGDTATAKFDLGLYFHQDAEGFLLRFESSEDVFDAPAAEAFLRSYRTVLQAGLNDSSLRLSMLPVLERAQQDALLRRGRGPERDISTTPLHEQILAVARARPGAVAIEDERGFLTYGQMATEIERIASYLDTESGACDAPVGVFLSRSCRLPVALLGVLAAGAAYLPLDPTYPPDRLRFMLEDSGVRVILTERALVHRLPPVGARPVLIDGDREAPVDESRPVPVAGEIAYRIYTSGSTGRPKGVDVTHRGLLNLLASAAREPDLEPDDVLLAVTSPAFDIAAVELFLPLLAGARLVVASASEVVDGTALLRRARTSTATIVQATPVTWRLLLAAGWNGDPPLRVLSCGEALDPDLAAALLDRAPAVWNLYGPTETTIWSTGCRLASADPPVPVGRPLDNTACYVLDANRNLLPDGAPGELWIGGAGVARGYHNRPDLTAERFVPDPWWAGGSMYRTGDRVRWDRGGNLHFLGRLDGQIKLRGHRIELGEIESVLRRLPGVTGAVVAARPDRAGQLALAAYLTGSPPSSGEIRRMLAAQLPAAMIPTATVLVDSFPLTPNGKIDRRALPAPGRSQGDTLDGHVPPRTRTEVKLATIWEDVLGVTRVGVRDSFFDLGGHSLLAVRLLDRIRAEYGKEVAPATFFRSPTIEGIGHALLRDETAGGSPLVPVRVEGSRPPLFFLHGQPLGGGFYSLKLARELGEDQPLYVLQPHALVGRAVPPTVEAIARSYLAAVRQARPHGPYHLAGFCLGGVIAFEMARQLLDAGEEVALLALLHTAIPEYRRTGIIRGSMDLVGRMGHRNIAERIRWYSAVRDLRSLGLLARRDWVHAARLLPPVLRGEIVQQRTGVPLRKDRGMDPYFWAVAGYRFRRYPGRLTLFRETAEWKADPLLGWHGKAAELQVYEVPGHGSVLREEVDELAAALRSALNAAAER